MLTEDDRTIPFYSTPGKKTNDCAFSCGKIDYLTDSNISDNEDENTSITSATSIEFFEQFTQFLKIQKDTPRSAQRLKRPITKNYLPGIGCEFPFFLNFV